MTTLQQGTWYVEVCDYDHPEMVVGWDARQALDRARQTAREHGVGATLSRYEGRGWRILCRFDPDGRVILMDLTVPAAPSEMRLQLTHIRWDHVTDEVSYQVQLTCGALSHGSGEVSPLDQLGVTTSLRQHLHRLRSQLLLDPVSAAPA